VPIRRDDEARRRERAIWIADVARVGGHDLATAEGRTAAFAAYQALQASMGAYVPRRMFDAAQWQAAVEARAAMCVHGLDPERCAGEPDAHHRWGQRPRQEEP